MVRGLETKFYEESLKKAGCIIALRKAERLVEGQGGQEKRWRGLKAVQSEGRPGIFVTISYENE